MDLQLKGRTAVVTGASAGIGQAVAVRLAAEGAQVVMVARRQNLLENIASRIEAAGALTPIIITADMMDPDAPERIANQAAKLNGRVDILVNSAGGSRPLPLNALEVSWEEAMMLNFTRLRQLSHMILPLMIGNKWGRIINITGKSEPTSLNGANAAKAAVHMWSKALSREVGKFGITLNCIAPGFIISEQIDKNFTGDKRREIEKSISVGAFGKADDLAVLVVFLASPLAHYITGTVIPVDGGLRRYAF